MRILYKKNELKSEKIAKGHFIERPKLEWDVHKKNNECQQQLQEISGSVVNEVFCFVPSSVLPDSFVLRNRQLLVTAKHGRQA